MTDWLLDTLLWTAGLIALVLLVRRPVARWLGPQAAYALWLIPALRLIMPPLLLPAWMAPAKPAETSGAAIQFPFLDPLAPVATPPGQAGSEAAASVMPATPNPVAFFESGPFIEIGLGVWLLGAAIFLYLRFNAYFRLRAELLEGSKEVGRTGKVRLIETAGTNAPLAFGVIDKVVALPEGFLAQPDQTARDLALAHEMAHHKGQDLLINVLVQPLFALHWFNPLGRYGWLALRRDQEAACDARVMAAKPAEERAAYANLIVSFAAGPNVALAAPMACPVLGEKSIIHRLRSLKMNNTSNNQRLAGRLMLGAAVLALPLTASISYAADDAPAAPSTPAAPAVSAVAPLPPAPPAPPAAPVASAPLAPVAAQTIVTVDPDSDEETEERVFIIRTDDEGAEGEEGDVERRVQRMRWIEREGEMSEERIEEIMIEVRRGLEEADRVMENMPAVIELALAEAEATSGRINVVMECDTDTEEVATTFENSDGTQTVKFCQRRVMVQAINGLREARDEIASDTEMSDEIRERVLRELDRQIERWESRGS